MQTSPTPTFYNSLLNLKLRSGIVAQHYHATITKIAANTDG